MCRSTKRHAARSARRRGRRFAQMFVAPAESMSDAAFERALFRARRLARTSHRRRRVLRRQPVAGDDRLQGDVRTRQPARRVPRFAARRPRRLRRDVPSAILDQHAAALAAGAAVPRARAQRRDQHDPRQPHLDAGARGEVDFSTSGFFRSRPAAHDDRFGFAKPRQRARSTARRRHRPARRDAHPDSARVGRATTTSTKISKRSTSTTRSAPNRGTARPDS